MNTTLTSLSAIVMLLVAQVGYTLTQDDVKTISTGVNSVALQVINKRTAELEVLEAFKEQLPNAHAEFSAKWKIQEAEARIRMQQLEDMAN